MAISGPSISTSSAYCPLQPTGCPQHFYITASLSPYGAGLLVSLKFGNADVGNCSRNVELWYPISGHLDAWVDGKTLIILGELMDVTAYPAGRVRDLLLRPGSESEVLPFYAPIEPKDALKRIGGDAISVILHLGFSVLYGAGNIDQKTYACSPLLAFTISRSSLEEWKRSWDKNGMTGVT